MYVSISSHTIEKHTRFGAHTRRCKGLIPLLRRLVTVANVVARGLKVNEVPPIMLWVGNLMIVMVTFRCCRMATAMPLGKSAGPALGSQRSRCLQSSGRFRGCLLYRSLTLLRRMNHWTMDAMDKNPGLVLHVYT